MSRYFVKRSDGDLANTQKIIAKVGHGAKARKVFVESVRQRKYKAEQTLQFFGALKNLLKELGKRGYTEQADVIRAPGRRLVKFEDLSRDQMFGIFASVQQAVAKWVWKATESDGELWLKNASEDLVFCANDVQAVMNLLLSIFDHNGYLAYDYEERGFDAFQMRMLSCVTK